MDKMDRDKIEKIIQDRKEANKKFKLFLVKVGIEMGGGPATVSSRFALKVLEYHGNKR